MHQIKRVLFIALIILPFLCAGQQAVDNLFKKKGEVYFKFNVSSKSELTQLTRIISIDNCKDNEVFAYANRKEFSEFLKLNYGYAILPHPSDLITPVMRNDINLTKSKAWDYYPTYTAYENMMYQFQATYPNLCRIDTIAILPGGHKLLVAKITDSVNIAENEPQFFYSSTMHGDETAGYILMLRLIDYLLSNYGTDARVTNLVNNIEIWINPLANPDGLYAVNDTTISGAKRYNTNNVDLNRNYPDPQYGQHPDGNTWQPETQAFMNFAQNHHIVMGANIHSGSEVCNYPWDVWSRLHADNNWWVRVCRQYADTVHTHSSAGYFDDLNNGITNGYAWYLITGGRQDYMNYFHHGREFTLELATTKVLPVLSLPNFWNYNYQSLLNYIEQSLYGIRGVVTDSTTGVPLSAKVFISGHDADSSHVYSHLPVGNYHRPIYAGVYSLTFSAPGYRTKTISNIIAANDSTTILDVQLAKTTSHLSDIKTMHQVVIYPNPTDGMIQVDIASDRYAVYSLKILNMVGEEVYTENLHVNKGNNRIDVDMSTLPQGIYFAELITDKNSITEKIIKY